MKSNYRILLLNLIIIFFTVKAVGQSQLGNMDSFSSPTFMTATAGIYITANSNNGIKKLFLYKNFENKAVIFDNANKQYKINNFNVDLLDNQFVSLIAKDSLFAFQGVDKAIINNHQFYRKDNKVLEVVSEGAKMDVSIHYYAKEMEEVKDKLNGKVIKPKHYVVRKEFYLNDKLNNEEMVIRRIKKKSILAMFNKSDKNKVLDYMKENDLDFKEYNHLKSIFDFYNSL